MKLRTLSGIALLAMAATFLGCAAFKNGSPPTKAEASFFVVTTNYVPTVTVTTNTVEGQPPVVTYQTNLEPRYVWAPGPAVKDVQTGLGLIPAYGGLAGTALGALATLWAWIRSSKAGATNVTLAQSIETMREFLQALPNGAVYDSALTTWLQKHQNDTGTVTQVLSLLQNDVSNPDAKAAAQQVIAAINALNPSALPPGTAVKV